MTGSRWLSVACRSWEHRLDFDIVHRVGTVRYVTLGKTFWSAQARALSIYREARVEAAGHPECGCAARMQEALLAASSLASDINSHSGTLLSVDSS